MKFICNATVFTWESKTAPVSDIREFDTLKDMLNWANFLCESGALAYRPTFSKVVKGKVKRVHIPEWDD